MILIIGGTSESIKIAKELKKQNKKFILSVATDYGEKISVGFRVSKGRKNKQELKEFILNNRIEVIVDASHPYALEVSKNAYEAAKECGVNFIRYERPSEKIEDERITYVKDMEEAAKEASKRGKRVLLTGSKNIKKIKNMADNIEVCARVLPTVEAIKECEEAGMDAKDIIALKGPFDYKQNLFLFEYSKADTIITKESGKTGGYVEKIEAALKLNMNVVVVERPKFWCENLVFDIKNIIKEC